MHHTDSTEINSKETWEEVILKKTVVLSEILSEFIMGWCLCLPLFCSEITTLVTDKLRMFFNYNFSFIRFVDYS